MVELKSFRIIQLGIFPTK